MKQEEAKRLAAQINMVEEHIHAEARVKSVVLTFRPESTTRCLREAVYSTKGAEALVLCWRELARSNY